MTARIGIHPSMAGVIRQHAASKTLPLDLVEVNEDGAAPQLDAVLTSGLSPAQLRKLLQGQPSIRWVAAQNAGVDALLVPEILERGVKVTRVRHVHDSYVAEFCMALILLAAKGLRDVVLANERHEWLEFQPGPLSGQTLTIVGYGEIGLALARRAKSFEMRVIGVRTRPRADGVADEVLGTAQLDEALRQADFVALTLPGGATRRHVIAERELRLLAKGAYVINVARGEVLDSDALDRVLREGGFAGALLDTFDVEPLPPNSPLWTNPRVLVTAHIAGIRSGAPRQEVLDQLVDNMARFTRGEPLQNEVDVRKGY